MVPLLDQFYFFNLSYLIKTIKTDNGPDGLILKEVFQKALSFNINSDKLVNEIGLDLRTMADIYVVIFDFTNDISEENIKNKISKHQNKSLLFLLLVLDGINHGI